MTQLHPHAPAHPTALATEPRAPRPGSFRTWLDRHYADQRGYFCLGVIDGDPQLESLKEEWFLYPAQAHQIAGRYADLATRGLNLYAGICLFSKPTRSYANALPSPWLWLDDAPADVACTELVRSSEGSAQAWVRLDQPLSANDRKRLQTAWRNGTGADQCSADAVHMARVPGGYNTKRHGRYLVHIERSEERVFSAHKLLAKAPALATRSGGEITDLAWPAVEKHLSNITALLASARMQLIKPATQTGRILAGELLSFPVHDRFDNSRSMNACAVALGLLLRGFPDEEIAAIVLHVYRTWDLERQKGTAWCVADIGRMLDYAHSKAPDARQSPTRYRANAPAAQLIEQPAASRARHDRPRQLDPLMLFSRYKADPTLCELSRKPRAAALDISTATLDRLDQVLRTEGLITIESAGRGLPGHVLVLGGVINIAADGVLSALDAPIADLSIETHQTDDCGPQCKGETHPPPETPDPAAAAPAPRSLVDAVRLAFDRVRVDPDTGERQRITRKRLLLALAECWPHPTPPARLDQVIADERTRRRCADTVADMATMNPPTLRAQIRLMERLGDKSREQGSNLYRFADWAARALRRELASRPAEPGRKPRKNCEALPNPRNVAERQQAELWQVADRGLELVRAERRGGGRGAGVSPQTPAPAGAAPDVLQGSLTDRLWRLKARREAVAQ